MIKSEDRQAILKDLMEFIPAEISYKKLYNAAPNAFDAPIYNWEEFKKRFCAEGGTEKAPEDAPSPIAPWFSESEFFPEKRLDVSIVKNDRYCPPFWHRLEFIKIVYVASGSTVLYVKDKKFQISEGNLCIVAPQVENAGFSNDNGDLVLNIIIKRSTFEKSFASLLIEGSWLSDYFWQMLYQKNDNDVLFFRKIGNSDLTEQVLQLYRELNLEKTPSNIMLKSYLMLLFGHLLRYYERDAEKYVSESKDEFRINEILRYIGENKLTVTLPELSDRFHLSEGYMSRYIKKKTGSPFNVILKQMRVEQAAVMLQNSECSIEDICYAVGYSDVSRFYRNFKEHYGMTPLQFRRINTI